MRFESKVFRPNSTLDRISRGLGTASMLPVLKPYEVDVKGNDYINYIFPLLISQSRITLRGRRDESAQIALRQTIDTVQGKLVSGSLGFMIEGNNGGLFAYNAENDALLLLANREGSEEINGLTVPDVEFKDSAELVIGACLGTTSDGFISVSESDLRSASRRFFETNGQDSREFEARVSNPLFQFANNSRAVVAIAAISSKDLQVSEQDISRFF
jgi:hypothetical protein